MDDGPPLTAEEMETESMIAMMHEIKQMQLANKDGANNNISDEERRKKAEDMIMKIASMMNLGDYDDEEDNVDDDEKWQNMNEAAQAEKNAK